MSKNIIKFFHAVIITAFLLGVTGCGYKGDPVYVDDSKQQEQQK
jgi:predicted small lipoprotein YifL